VFNGWLFIFKVTKPSPLRGPPVSRCQAKAAAAAPWRVRRHFGARGRSSVRYGTRLGDLKESWFILFSN
jgi:hypothetical protein